MGLMTTQWVWAAALVVAALCSIFLTEAEANSVPGNPWQSEIFHCEMEVMEAQYLDRPSERSMFCNNLAGERFFLDTRDAQLGFECETGDAGKWTSTELTETGSSSAGETGTDATV